MDAAPKAAAPPDLTSDLTSDLTLDLTSTLC